MELDRMKSTAYNWSNVEPFREFFSSVGIDKMSLSGHQERFYSVEALPSYRICKISEHKTRSYSGHPPYEEWLPSLHTVWKNEYTSYAYRKCNTCAFFLFDCTISSHIYDKRKRKNSNYSFPLLRSLNSDDALFVAPGDSHPYYYFFSSSIGEIGTNTFKNCSCQANKDSVP